MTLWMTVTCLFLLLALCTVSLAYLAEKKRWNKGHCPLCGGPWTLFDVDSQGGRGYVCRNHSKPVWGPWISYPGIDGRD